MKTLQASNGDVIRMEDDHADFFLSRHQVETESQMAYREIKPLQDVIDDLQREVSKDDLNLSADRKGSVLYRLTHQKG
jgi:hypothetical protein